MSQVKVEQREDIRVTSSGGRGAPPAAPAKHDLIHEVGDALTKGAGAGGYLAWYLKKLQEDPLRTKMITSGSLAGLQEFLASWIAKDRNKHGHYFTTRVPWMAAYGAFISAPLGHVMISLLQRLFAGRTSLRAKILQIIVSNLVIAPIQNGVYLTSMAIIAGARTFHQIRATVRAGFWPVMKGIFPNHIDPLPTPSPSILHSSPGRPSVRPRPLPVPVQTLRIGHARARLDVHPAQDLLDRALDLLAVGRDGDLRTLGDDAGDVARRQLAPHDALDLRDERLRQRLAVLHLEEQHDGLVGVLRAPAPDAQRVLDGGGAVGQHEVVDLGGAEAHARGLEDAVAAPEHDEPARARVHAHEVAVVPDAGEAVEVRRAVLGVAGGAPEAHRLAGEGPRAHQVARLAAGGFLHSSPGRPSVRPRPLPVPVQTLRIGHARARLDVHPAQDLLDRALDLLAVGRDGDLRTLGDDAGDVARRQLAPHDALDLRDERLRQRLAVLHLEEQHDGLVGVLRAPAPDAQRVLDGGGAVGQHEVVDLGGAEAHARGLEDAVAAPEHDEPARARVHAHEVAVVPDAGEAVEVRRAVLGVAGGAPEAHRLAGEGPRAHQVARLAAGGHVRARVVPRRHRHPEPQRLDLARVDWPQRARRAEERDDVRAAGDGAEVDGAEGAVDVAECRGRKRRAGRVDAAERGEREALGARQQGFLLEHREVLGAGAKVRDGELVDEARHGEVVLDARAVGERLEGGAVVEDEGRAGCQAGHEPVPHHPGAGGEVEESIARPDVALKDVFLLVLDQSADRAVHDAFRCTGSA
nr:peroxisomal membrane protein 2 [Quercus suber]